MSSKPKECPVCDIASAFSVTKGICNTFKENGLDCKEFLKILEDPNAKASAGVKAFLKMRDKCTDPNAREMLDYITKTAQLDSLEFDEEETAPAAK